MNDLRSACIKLHVWGKENGYDPLPPFTRVGIQAAKGVGCKPMTLETTEVRILPDPYPSLKEEKIMDEKEELKKKINTLRDHLWKIEAAERKKENDELVGKYFRYRNSYSAPSKKWWIYHKVIKSSDSYTVTAFSFEINPYNGASVEMKEIVVGVLGQACTEETFYDAWHKTVSWINQCAVNAEVFL